MSRDSRWPDRNPDRRFRRRNHSSASGTRDPAADRLFVQSDATYILDRDRLVDRVADLGESVAILSSLQIADFKTAYGEVEDRRC